LHEPRAAEHGPHGGQASAAIGCAS
jgi:hypothetical protein